MGQHIVLLIGESGSGKTSVAAELEKRGLIMLRSYTTRPPRYDGEGGHIFVTDDEFDALQGRVAFTEFDRYRYCATAQQVEENDVYVIDPAGYNTLRNVYRGNKDILPIFLDAKPETRRQRMQKRGDSDAAVKQRLTHDKKAFGKFRKYVYKPGSEVLPIYVDERSVDEVCNIIQEYVELLSCVPKERAW